MTPKPKIIKPAKITRRCNINHSIIHFKGDPHLVLDEVKSLNKSGSLTFHLSPEGSIGDITFTEIHKDEIVSE